MALRITGQCIRSNEMQRRNFLKIIAGAVALGLPPALLNITQLRVAGTIRKTFHFPLGQTQTVTEVGISDPIVGVLHRHVLAQTITVHDDEVLDLVFEFDIEDLTEKLIGWSIEEDGKVNTVEIDT